MFVALVGRTWSPRRRARGRRHARHAHDASDQRASPSSVTPSPGRGWRWGPGPEARARDGSGQRVRRGVRRGVVRRGRPVLPKADHVRERTDRARRDPSVSRGRRGLEPGVARTLHAWEERFWTLDAGARADGSGVRGDRVRPPPGGGPARRRASALQGDPRRRREGPSSGSSGIAVAMHLRWSPEGRDRGPTESVWRPGWQGGRDRSHHEPGPRARGGRGSRDPGTLRRLLGRQGSSLCSPRMPTPGCRSVRPPLESASRAQARAVERWWSPTTRSTPRGWVR